MTTVTNGTMSSTYVSPEMETAYREAIQSVRNERTLPAEIQKARRQAILRWIDRLES